MIYNLEHKKDLINRLKRSEPYNTSTYEAEMTQHMALHNDILEMIHTILKQDVYFRTLEELLVIDVLPGMSEHLYPTLTADSSLSTPASDDCSTLHKQITTKLDKYL